MQFAVERGKLDIDARYVCINLDRMFQQGRLAGAVALSVALKFVGKDIEEGNAGGVNVTGVVGARSVDLETYIGNSILKGRLRRTAFGSKQSIHSCTGGECRTMSSNSKLVCFVW